MEQSDQEKHAELADEFERIYGQPHKLVTDTGREVAISTNDVSTWWLMESIKPEDGAERTPVQLKYFGLR